MKSFKVLLGCLALAFATEARAQPTRFHKLYTDTNALFDRTQFKHQVVHNATNIFVLLEHDDGAMVVKTDLSGNVVWSHLYGTSSTNAATLTLGVGGALILGCNSLSDAVIAKLDPSTGNVIWAKRYAALDDVATVSQRGSTYVVMGPSPYSGRTKPLAMAINDSDGSVVWSKLYLEVDATYTTSYDYFVHAATVTPDLVTFAGIFYNGANVPSARPRVAMLTVEASNGSVSTGSMHSYDLSWAGGSLETDSDYVWDIVRVNGSAGDLQGFALAGTYPEGGENYHAPVVLRVAQDGAPLWSRLYFSSNSTGGFGRGIQQNAYFFGGRLDVFTSWTFYRNAIDSTGTASGLLRLNESDGSVIGMTVYDAPGYYAGESIQPDGTGGYVALGAKDIAPYTSFELIKVGQAGGGAGCSVDDATMTSQTATATDLSIAMVSPTVAVTPVDFALSWADRALTVADCAP